MTSPKQQPPSVRQFYAIATLVPAVLSVGGIGVGWTVAQAYLVKEPWVVELQTESETIHHHVEHLMKLSPRLEEMLKAHNYLARGCLNGDRRRSDCRILGLPTQARSSSVLLLPTNPTEETP